MAKTVQKSIHCRWIGLKVLLIAIGLNLMIFSVLPGGPPQDVRVTNITDSTITVSWTTTEPTRGWLIYNQQPNRFLRKLQFVCLGIPILSPYCFRAAYDEVPTPSYNHQVTLKKLAADSSYYYRIVSDQHSYKSDKNKHVLPDIQTHSTLENLTVPQPAFSRVLKSDGKTGVPGALVYLTLLDGKTRKLVKSSTLSTVTDWRGVWQADLGNFRQFNRESFHKIAADDILLIEVKAGPLGEAKQFQPAGKTNPVEPIILK